MRGRVRKHRLFLDFPTKVAMQKWLEDAWRCRLVPNDMRALDACPSKEEVAEYILKQVRR